MIYDLYLCIINNTLLVCIGVIALQTDGFTFNAYVDIVETEAV